MSFTASIPVAQIDTANAALLAAAFGPDNFTVPLRPVGGTGDASTVALVCIPEMPLFRAAVALIPNVVITDGAALERNFAAHCTANALEWEDPTFWFENPVMIGDQRTHGGKLWESLVDYNVWTPPVAWREIVSEGYPAWVQPTGAHDAYAIGARVTHLGQDWDSNTPANVGEPGVFGWVVI